MTRQSTNFLPYLEFSTAYVDLPGAKDAVHADLLTEALNDGCQCYINRIIDWIGSFTRSDGAFDDNLIRLRMLSDEVKEAFPTYDSFFNARLSSLAYVPPAGIQTVDGVLTQEDDVVLLMGQGDPADNGLYRVSAALWTRIPTFDDGYQVNGTVHVWVTEGVDRGFTSWVWNAPDRSVVGTDPQEWVLFHAEYRASLNNDTVEALLGTAGVPSNINRYVTNEDPRMSVFEYDQDGLVPGPAIVGGDLRFLAEDGVWRVPDIVTIVGNVVRTDIDSFMDSGVSIHFDGTGTIDGIPDPVNPSEVSNKNYIDVELALRDINIAALVNWKLQLDAITGLILVDGAGGYSQLAPVSSSFLDDSAFGGGGQSIAASIDALVVGINNALAAAAAAQADATQALADAAAAQADATAALAWQTALDAITGILVGDGGGNYAGIPLPGGGTTFLRDDGVFATVPMPAPSRGEAYGVPAPLAMTGPGTWDQVLIPTAGLLTNMTFVGNGLQADKAMSIQLVVSISGDLNAAQAIDWAVAVNGAPAGIVAKSIQREHYGGVGTQPDVTTLTCLLDLALNDVVTLWGQQVAGSANFTFNNVNMNVQE